MYVYVCIIMYICVHIYVYSSILNFQPSTLNPKAQTPLPKPRTSNP